MAMSFRAARNLGLLILFVIILFESLFAYLIMARSSDRLTGIITTDQVKLMSWYDVAEIVATGKDQLYDFRLGKREVVASVDLLIDRALKEVESIRVLATDREEIASIDEIVKTANTLKGALNAYGIEVHQGSRDSDSAKQMEGLATRTADRIAELGRDAAAYVSRRIEEKNKDILKITHFSQSTLGFVLLVAIVATVVNGLFMARALARPIEKLVAGTKRLAEGDLHYRVDISGADEIGQLARSFNVMAEELTSSQHELLKAKRYTDNIIMSMMNALVVVNRHSNIVIVNKATCDLLGYTEAELIGKPISMIFARGYFREIGIDDLAEGGFISNVETTYMAKDGRNIRVLFSGAVMCDEDKKFAGIVCVAQDITLQAEAMRAGHLASLGELAAGVAHEINNPINSIINFAQILIDELERLNVDLENYPRLIIKEGDRVAAIVSSLLSFAREGEKVKSLVSILEVLDETLSLAEAQMHKDGIALKTDVPRDLPRIDGHFQQIQQVFLNIMNNARYALNAKFPGVHPDKLLRIQVQQLEQDGRVFLATSFYDHGSGIPSEIIDKVINPFFSTKPAGRGTGLGLAISHGIIADHGGRLLFESVEGEYTKVTVLLPVFAGDREEAGASQKES